MGRAAPHLKAKVTTVGGVPRKRSHLNTRRFAAAEEIKIRHGYALPELLEDDRTIDVSAFDTGDGRPVSRRQVSEIIEPRLEETFELAIEQLEELGRIPGHISYGQLRLHPWWDPLREHPRFENVVAAAAEPVRLT